MSDFCVTCKMASHQGMCIHPFNDVLTPPSGICADCGENAEHKLHGHWPTDRELIDNLYEWLYQVLNRLDQIENPGMKPQWPEGKSK